MNDAQAVAVIEKIYRLYASRVSGLDLACHRGCAACCTRNVTMTAFEGELILRGIYAEDRLEWFMECLQTPGMIGRPVQTTNQWAEACLEGLMPDNGEPEHILEPCPFLDRKQACTIYELRPFSCRCFGSTVDCATSGTASQPDILMEINTVTLQILEHLGRGNWWGNMLDVLPVLINRNRSDQEREQGGKIQERMTYLRRARPLPGFLVMPDQQAAVGAYLDALFSIRLGRSTLGEILQIPL